MSKQRTTELPPRLIPPSRLLSVAEVAAIIGVSRKMIHEWIDQGLLPVFRLNPEGRITRVREQDLNAFIDKHIRQEHLQLHAEK